MKRIKEVNHELAAAAAILYENGINQRAISEKLGIETSKVSRLLKQAEDAGWIEVKPRLHQKAIPVDIYEKAEILAKDESELQHLLSGWSPKNNRCEVTVIYSSGGDDVFYEQTAEALNRLLVKCRHVGTLYGRTIWQMLSRQDAQRELMATPFQKLNHIDFIPLCGEPIHLMDEEREPPSHSASHLAEAFQVLADKKNHALKASLSGVHAYIRSGNQRAYIQEYFKGAPGYKKIFGEKGLVHAVDAIVTGIGAFSGKGIKGVGGLMRERLYQETGLSRAELESLVYGDIGGVLLEREGLSEEQRKQVAKYNDGWMGLRHHHILACAKKAKPGVPGVVVISHDARRAEVIQAAICAGLVNHVVMDGKLSEALKALPAPNKVED